MSAIRSAIVFPKLVGAIADSVFVVICGHDFLLDARAISRTDEARSRSRQSRSHCLRNDPGAGLFDIKHPPPGFRSRWSGRKDAMTEDTESEPALAPSADTPAENRRKIKVGKGLLVLIAGLAVLAFLLYLMIGIRVFSSA
jgi:hypothetical protein